MVVGLEEVELHFVGYSTIPLPLSTRSHSCTGVAAFAVSKSMSSLFMNLLEAAG